jgi:hypothetical protein
MRQRELGVQRAFFSQPAALKNAGVDHADLDVFMPQQFLDRSNTCPGPQVLGIITVLQEMCGKGITEAVPG